MQDLSYLVDRKVLKPTCQPSSLLVRSALYVTLLVHRKYTGLPQRHLWLDLVNGKQIWTSNENDVEPGLGLI